MSPERAPLHDVAASLRAAVAVATPRLRAVSSSEAAKSPDGQGWSRKEILGHLIDSATNNHQRFVRAQLQGELRFPGYQQDGWIATQNYTASDWPLLVDLWRAYNLHLADVIERIPAAHLKIACTLDEREPVTLQFLAEDYVTHLEHHVQDMALEARVSG